MSAASTVLRIGKLGATLFGAGAIVASSALGFLFFAGAGLLEGPVLEPGTEAAAVAMALTIAILVFHGAAVLEARRLLELGAGVAAAYARYVCAAFSLFWVAQWVAAYLADIYLGVPGLVGPLLLLAGCMVYGRDTARRVTAAGLIAAGSVLLAAAASSRELGVMYAASGLTASIYIVAEVAGLRMLGLVAAGAGVAVSAGAAAYYAYRSLDTFKVTEALDALRHNGSELAIAWLAADIGFILAAVGAVLVLMSAAGGVVVALTRPGGAIHAERAGMAWRS